MTNFEIIQAVFTVFTFLLSVYAAVKTIGFNKRQNEMAQTQEDLNKLLLRKETNEAIDSYKAELGVKFIKIGNNSNRLKVFNKGKGLARNVRINFPETLDMFSMHDIDSKFPLEIMEQHQSVELIASVHLGSKRKIIVELFWDDDTGISQSKVLYATL
jgi:hypothetical protein